MASYIGSSGKGAIRFNRVRIIGGSFHRLQLLLLTIGLVAGTILLFRFAWDFSAEMPAWLAIPFWLLVASVLMVASLNIFVRRGEGRKATGGWESLLLTGAIPIAFLASSLDCTGLSAQGCSPFCTFIKLGWITLMAIVCLAYLFALRRQRAVPSGNSEAAKGVNIGALLLLVLTLMTFVPLAPHCVCVNAGNGWWIRTLGASPTCYSWGFGVGLVSISSLNARARTRISLLLCLAIIGGALGFFITHHYFHFPW